MREVSLDQLAKLRSERKNFVVYIYSPTCPYCIEGLPIFERETAHSSFKEIFKFNGKPFGDDFANQRLRAEFERRIGPKITHFPTIFLFYENRGDYKAVTMDTSNLKNKLDTIHMVLNH